MAIAALVIDGSLSFMASWVVSLMMRRIGLPWPMLVRTIALALGALGLLFITLPVPASVLFGIKADSDTALFYMRALGIRDAALCVSHRGLDAVHRRLRAPLGASTVSPAGDLTSPPHLSLDAPGGFCLALNATWTQAPTRDQ